MPVYPGAQDFHLQAVEHARHTKKEQGGLKAALLSGEMIRKLSNTHTARGDSFESDALTRSFS
jgi:hypothetical protein